jgi:hypothetical protein
MQKAANWPQEGVYRPLTHLSLPNDQRLTPVELGYILINLRVADPRSAPRVGLVHKSGVCLKQLPSLVTG